MRLGRPVWIAGEAGPGEREGLVRLAAGGARTFGSLAELLEGLGLGEPAGAAAERGPGAGAGLRGPAAALWGALDGEPRSTDDVARRAGIGAGDALAGLMELELLGLVERRPGRGFARRAGG
jgi:DNA processing protein